MIPFVLVAWQLIYDEYKLKLTEKDMNMKVFSINCSGNLKKNHFIMSMYDWRLYHFVGTVDG